MWSNTSSPQYSVAAVIFSAILSPHLLALVCAATSALWISPYFTPWGAGLGGLEEGLQSLLALAREGRGDHSMAFIA